MADQTGMATPGAMTTPGATTGHAGDLGNMQFGADGSGRLQLTTDRFTLAELADADGSALIVQADRDDLQTDPGVNSGARVACGVIFPPQGTPEAGTPAVGTPPVAGVISTALATAIGEEGTPTP
jgi:hypothetical protein